MKLNKVLFGLVMSASAYSALAVAQAPVVDVNSTGLSSSSLSEQLTTLERKLDARNRAQVKIQRQLDQLQTEMNELRGVTELHTHQLSQVLERQRELYQELDRRVTEALKPANQVPSSLAANNASLSTPSTSYSNNLTENEAYDRALNLVLKDKRYEQAIPEFRAFNKSFPQSTYAPNAHYWLGQLLFNKGELVEAEQEFRTVVERFSDSAKRPDAMLKLAMVAQKQNNNNKAINLYRELIKAYPDSTSAKLAKPRLDALLK
ncbi:tol-pal system protein YbgF [Litorilituus sediminis]|uniref:Cell division coordinator CpoB n=1 Tax=Litorilituus sediminis TaxID=718192 RepID=A0A4P6P1X4_9GAMM|nr:tol-pal system protein YbgF [Litorilituus sediminis]QBG35093.1 tol-pal system protein YbgF [Litorilituus sediminis]